MQVFQVSDGVIALFFLATSEEHASVQFRAGRQDAIHADLVVTAVSNDLQVLAKATLDQPMCMHVLRCEFLWFWRQLDDQLCAMPLGNLAWRRVCRMARRAHDTLKQLDYVLSADEFHLHELAVRP